MLDLLESIRPISSEEADSLFDRKERIKDLKDQLAVEEDKVTNEGAKENRIDRYEKVEKFIDDLGEKELKALEVVMEQIAMRPNEEEKFRKSGEPVIYHCLNVAMILKEKMGVGDENVIVAAILHDYLEDIEIKNADTFNQGSEKIRNMFGDSAWRMVSGMTKFKFDGDVKDEATYGNVLMEAQFEPGILLIKLADRLHNWETIGGQKRLSKRAEAVTETEEFFLLIAEKIGLQSVVNEFKAAIKNVQDEIDSFNKTVREEEKITIVPKQKAMVERSLDILFANGVLKEKLNDLMGIRKPS